MEKLAPVEFTEYYNKAESSSTIMSKIKERDDDLLYCTFNDVRKIVEDYYGDRQSAIYKTKFSQVIACVAAWNNNKQIYKFNSDLAKMLSSQELDGDLPIDTLKNVPYKCFYIQTDIIKSNHNSDITCYDGFFVYFDRNEYCDDDLELRMLIISKERQRQILVPVHLISGKTLTESLKTTYKEVGCDYKPDDMTMKEAVNEFMPMVNTMVQMILYLCAENKDVIENKRIEFNKRDTNTKKKKKNKQYTQKKENVKEWNVGSVVSREFRRSIYIPKDSEHGTGTGSKKSPHMRKAHWHHFWTGTGDNKRLVVKWISPMYINKNIKDEPSPTINNVRNNNPENAKKS